MAEGEKGQVPNILSLNNTKISVSVETAVPDLLVVSYEFGVKVYRGVLLDCTKRNLPCGVPNINPYFNIPPKNPDDDTMHSVNQRFAYLDPNTPKKKMPNIRRHKTGNMTVRLRPRQVLCSKCKGICNENSENVSRKRKTLEPALSSLPPSSKRSINAPITRSVNILNNVNNGGGRNSSKRTLRGKESSTPLVSSEMKSRIDSNANKKPLGNFYDDKSEEIDKKRSTNQRIPKKCKICPAEDVQLPPVKLKRTLKRKRNVESVESAENDVNQGDDVNNLQAEPTQAIDSLSTDVNTTATATTASTTAISTSTTSSTRTIKISYGPQGEGTVLKIPAQIDSDIGNDSEENVDRAARRAWKRAKKEAKRKVMHGGSPVYLTGNSPRCLGGGSPRHGISESNSTIYSVMSSCDLPKKRKHKKKKHKEDKGRKHKEGEHLNSCSTSDKPDDLSSSDEHGEMVPDFPSSPNQTLLMHCVNPQTITSALGLDGCRLIVGDVVWGKTLGFPWWPGKILTLASYGRQGIQAHVAWYASSTTSFLQCDQLSNYLDNYAIRFNKKRRGSYKEAVKQATADAKENAENRVRQPLGNSPSHNIIQVVPPALASPRQIDVVS